MDIQNEIQKDIDVNAIKKNINNLRETLDMIEWCIDGNSNNAQLFINEIPQHVEELINHFK